MNSPEEPSDSNPGEKAENPEETALVLASQAQEGDESVALQLQKRLPPHEDPFLVYVGGLDKASQPTMVSAARLVVSTLSSGKITDPTLFPWQTVNYGVVKRLRSLLRERKFAPRSINKALTLVRSIVREAWIFNLVSHEQYEKLRILDNLKSDNDLPSGRVVERDEIAYLLLACHGFEKEFQHPENLIGFRDAALISLLVGSGLREKEAVNLTREDYNASNGTIRVLYGKGHKQRQTYVEIAYDKPLRRFLELVPGGFNDPLIPRLAPEGKAIQPLRHISTQTVDKALGKRAIQAGITRKNGVEDEPSFTPHDLRRSFITHQLDKGIDPLRVARAVGHASPKTTMLYDRRTAESDRQAIRGDEFGEDKVKARLLYIENIFKEAWGGRDPRMHGSLDMLEVSVPELLNSAWRGTLRDLRKGKEGYICSLRFGQHSLLAEKVIDLADCLKQHLEPSSDKGNYAVRECLRRYPGDVEQWTVKLWPDTALADSLLKAEEIALKQEKPCFDERVVGSVPARYKGIVKGVVK